MTAKFALFSFAQPIIPIFGEHAEMTSVRAFVFRIFSSLFRSLKARPNLRRVGFNSENFAINCEIWAFLSQKFRSSTRNLTIFSGFFLGYQFWPLFFDAKKKKAARLIHITSFIVIMSFWNEKIVAFFSLHKYKTKQMSWLWNVIILVMNTCILVVYACMLPIVFEAARFE